MDEFYIVYKRIYNRFVTHFVLVTQFIKFIYLTLLNQDSLFSSSVEWFIIPAIDKNITAITCNFLYNKELFSGTF